MYGSAQIENRMGSAGAPKVPESMIGNLSESVERELKELFSSARRLHNLADRLVGSRPEAVEKGGETSSTPICAMQALERNLAGLQQLRSSIADATDRLERL